MMTTAHRQGGFTLAVGIFLLVIMAALGAFVLSVSTATHTGAAWDLLGARAYQSARAGIEWGAFQALRNASCSASSSFSPGGALSDFTVTLQCAASSTDELGTPVRVYDLTATACNRPSAGSCPGTAGSNYVERQISASVSN